MPKETIMEYISSNTEDDNQVFRLVLQSAPLLKRVKKSCIVSVSSATLRAVRNELKKAAIECVILSKNSHTYIVMLYRKGEFETYLKRDDVKKFLYRYGYMGDNCGDYLVLLSKRINAYYASDSEFPHEIGIFLGYPVQDVEGFIENSGKNFLMSGYWKVYSDIQRAEELFKKIDFAKDAAAKELMSGKKLYEIAC